MNFGNNEPRLSVPGARGGGRLGSMCGLKMFRRAHAEYFNDSQSATAFYIVNASGSFEAFADSV